MIASLYLTNGNPQPGPKFDYKLAWFKRLHAHARKLLKEDAPVILSGDFDVAPTAIDIYPTKSWDDDALVQPASRAAFAKLVKQGWTDSLRVLHGDERLYSFWQLAKQLPARRRITARSPFAKPALAPRLKAAGVDRAVRGQPEASDHAPVWIELSSPRRRKVH